MTNERSANSNPWLMWLVTFTVLAICSETANADSVDWRMTLSPAAMAAQSGETIDFMITFANNLSQDMFFSDFGDGQGITVDLEGSVLGSGACGPGVDCFVQDLFVTSPDPIDIPAGSTRTTFDLGQLDLGTHIAGDEITVVAKGGPDSLLTGGFPNPAFAETSATVDIVPTSEPSPIVLCLLGAGWFFSACGSEVKSPNSAYRLRGQRRIHLR
jgi:hypothetical protein